MTPRITKQHQFTTGSHKGRREIRTPHQFADGFFRVFSPEGVLDDDGKRHWNRLDNARNVKMLTGVADHVENGWGVRMKGPLTRSPSLCWKDIEVVR